MIVVVQVRLIIEPLNPTGNEIRRRRVARNTTITIGSVVNLAQTALRLDL